MHTTLTRVTQRIIERSGPRRALYEERMQAQHRRGVHRGALDCGNLAHGFAACNVSDKQQLKLTNSANLGRGVIKVSAVKPEFRVIEAPVRVFADQEALKVAFNNGELDKDFIAVVRFQGPRANGMPELHKLTSYLGSLMDRGFRVALITDRRMSGASGKVPAAIHMTPEAVDGGPLARLRDGDRVRLDSVEGRLEVLLDAETFNARECAREDLGNYHHGLGREMFAGMRALVGSAEEGASTFGGFEAAEVGRVVPEANEAVLS